MTDTLEKRPPPAALDEQTLADFEANVDAALAGVPSGDQDDGREAPSAPERTTSPAAPKPEKRAEPAERARDDRGRFDKQPDAPAEDAKPVEQQKPKDDPELEKALGVLRRSKMSGAVLRKLERAEIIEQAAALRPALAERDDLFRRLGQSKSTPTETALESGLESRGKEPSERPETDDLRSAVRPVLEELGLDGDEETERKLTGLVKLGAQSQSREIAALRSELAYLRGETASNIGESVRQELVRGGRYPEFESRGEGTLWHQVEAKAVSLLKSEDYGGNIRACLDDAVLLVAGRGRELPDPAERTRRERARDNGRPDLPTGSAREKPLTEEQRLDRGIDSAMSNAGLI